MSDRDNPEQDPDGVGIIGEIVDTPASYARSLVSTLAQGIEDRDLRGIFAGIPGANLIANALDNFGDDTEAPERLLSKLLFADQQQEDDFWANLGVGDYLQRTIDEQGLHNTALNNAWVKRAIGLAGDVGLDPVTWVALAAKLAKAPATAARLTSGTRATGTLDAVGTASTRTATVARSADDISEAMMVVAKSLPRHLRRAVKRRGRDGTEDPTPTMVRRPPRIGTPVDELTDAQRHAVDQVKIALVEGYGLAVSDGDTVTFVSADSHPELTQRLALVRPGELEALAASQREAEIASALPHHQSLVRNDLAALTDSQYVATALTELGLQARPVEMISIQPAVER